MTTMLKSAILALLLPAGAAFGSQTTTNTPEAVRWQALAELESGKNDEAHGRAGEISRWQMMKSVWRQETTLPYASASNPFTALNVAKLVMEKRVASFTKTHHRAPDDREWSLLWHSPARVDRPRPLETRYANRFENLCSAPKSYHAKP